jgi:HAD superfamily hydrolase (TIGR01509 family)
MNEEEIVKLYNKSFGCQINPEKLVDRKHQFFLEKVHLVQPVKAVIEVVFLYRSILPMAVVSGGRRSSVYKTLESLGIRDSFTVILTADDPIPPKPAPDLFLEAARHLNTESQFCQVFEDGDLGIQAALAAGMKATDIRQYLKKIQ